MSEIVISASEANRGFSRLLALVRGGARVRVTSHGKTVAVILPPSEDERARGERQAAALEDMQRHWATIKPRVIGPWTREELYD